MFQDVPKGDAIFMKDPYTTLWNLVITKFLGKRCIKKRFCELVYFMEEPETFYFTYFKLATPFKKNFKLAIN